MTELEQDALIAAFDEAADALVQIAAQNEPRVGRDVIVDATRYATPSRSYHCCTKQECPARKRVDKPTPVRLDTDDEVDEARRDQATEPPLSPAEERALRSSKNTWVDGKWRYARLNGCKFRGLDKDAHFRSYTRPNGTKSTVLGGCDIAATDHLTGGVLAGVIFPANRQEHAAMPLLLRRLERATGKLPETIAGDRALSVRKTARLLARRKIARVSPFRRQSQHMRSEADLRTERWDEHGPRCEHCGGPSNQHGAKLGLTIVRGEPVIRHRCMLGTTADCLKIQQIRCNEEPLVLNGLSPTSERYQALAAAERNLERTHYQKRRRFAVAGKDDTGKLKRRGASVQRLRAAIARFLEWFYICLRHGWLGQHPYRNLSDVLQRRAWGKVEKLLHRRRAAGLELPYCPVAIRLGLAPPLPPPPGSPVADTPRRRS